MTMTATSTGRFVWFEYVSGDSRKAQGFYGELFNWGKKDVPMPDGAYTMIALGDRTIGGYQQRADMPATWISHLLVKSAKETAAQVTALGGKVLKEAFK